MEYIKNSKGKFIGWVDRTLENVGDDSEVVVELPCGYKERFWLVGLTNEEYIKRTKQLKKLINK